MDYLKQLRQGLIEFQKERDKEYPSIRWISIHHNHLGHGLRIMDSRQLAYWNSEFSWVVYFSIRNRPKWGIALLQQIKNLGCLNHYQCYRDDKTTIFTLNCQLDLELLLQEIDNLIQALASPTEQEPVVVIVDRITSWYRIGEDDE